MACMKSNNFKKEKLYKAFAVLCWIVIWQGAAALLGQPLLLSSPVGVAQRLIELLREKSFYQTLAFSLFRIMGGFLLGLILGALMAALSARFALVKYLLQPLMGTVRAVPVASFIILALVWLSSGRLSVFISFLMVLPIVYVHLLEGFGSADKRMLEMAKVFRMPWHRRLLLIDLPHLKPYLSSAISLAVGMSWKSGVAAEVIGIPMGSIGEALYQSKIYLDMSALYAWTLVIVFLSVCFERLILLAVRRGYARLEAL